MSWNASLIRQLKRRRHNTSETNSGIRGVSHDRRYPRTKWVRRWSEAVELLLVAVGDGEAGVAALVAQTSLVSFSSQWLQCSTRPSKVARHRASTHDLAIQLLKMSGTDNAPSKRKAEPRERQDGGNKRAKVSSFSSCDCQNSGHACGLGLAIPFSFRSYSESSLC